MDALTHLKAHLKGKVIIVGIGNTLRNDDGFGSLLAARIKGKIPYTVYDCGPSPENYLEKIIKEKPDSLVIVDAVDFGGRPGEIQAADADQVKTVNLFSTHNASITLTINYLQSQIPVDIIILMGQPRSIAFGDTVSPEIVKSLAELEEWFCATAKEEN